MPTYLCHGFRWQRRSVRVYVILQDLGDVSPEWIIPARSSRCILKSFYDIFDFLPYCSPNQGRYTPTRELDVEASTTANDDTRSRGCSQSQSTRQSRSRSRPSQHRPLPPAPAPPPAADGSSSNSSLASSSPADDFSAQSWSAIKLLEEYDPHDLTAVSRPYAYVADYAVRVDLSCSIVDEIARYEQQQLQSAYPAIAIPSRGAPAGEGLGWFEQLRDQLQRGEEIRWYVVVNGDEVRDWPDEPSEPSEPESNPGPGPEQDDHHHRPQHHHQQHQQQEQYQHQHRPPPTTGRPLPTREQRQHHAQYVHQQRIFEGGDWQQEQVQGQKLVLEASHQPQRKQDQEQSIGWRKERDTEEGRERVQEQQGPALKKQQEIQGRQERDWQRGKASAQDEERRRNVKREWKMNIKVEEVERARQRSRDARLRGTGTESKPPMVPEKDHYHFPRPPTANTSPTTAPQRTKVLFDVDVNARPKTPGGKGSGLRKLFGRAKAGVVS